MAEKPHQEVPMAPDPDEDDLDDLDEVLDEFSKPKSSENSATKSSPSTAPTSSGPGRPSAAADPAAPAAPEASAKNDEELNKTLQAGMENLIGELDADPEMQKEFERMMQELISAGAAPTDAEAAKHIGLATDAVMHPEEDTGDKPKAGLAGKEKESFQDTIRRTMERMQASGEQASAAAAAGTNSSEEDMLAQMMRELQASGGGGEEDFNSMLMGMMAQLTHKEILYEPMKELHDKFPAWLEKNQDKTSADELDRYKGQQKVVGEIVGRFERKGYSDDNEADREYIVERMQKMQAQGSPPPDLVGDMSAAQEALGDLETGCPTQ